MRKLVRYKTICNRSRYINIDYIIEIYITRQPYLRGYGEPYVANNGQKFEYGMDVYKRDDDDFIPLTEECFNRICSVMGIANEEGANG
jgi:hypothetical protein